jgi:Uma2 family endonuclease
MQLVDDRLRSYEYWHGKTVPKGTATWTHGLLQGVIGDLLTEAGFLAGAGVELRIAPDARPKPDVIATKSWIEETYPTKAVEVAVEILSDDPMMFVIEKCVAYLAWGFAEIYVVDPGSRLVFRWTGSAFECTNLLTSFEVAKMWDRLDLALGQKQDI